MPSASNLYDDIQTRSYERTDCAVFRKTKEAFGGLSNMAGGFPLKVNGVIIRTSEALYQACRFPHMPDVQKLIINQKSPMTAKMKGKPHRSNSRADWNNVQINIMRWCLRVKLAQNWSNFSNLLLETRDLHIVEETRRDQFWGAKPVDEETLNGMNVLGEILMELRTEVKTGDHALLLNVQPLSIPNFDLLGEPIEPVLLGSELEDMDQSNINIRAGDKLKPIQGVLFEDPLVKTG